MENIIKVHREIKPRTENGTFQEDSVDVLLKFHENLRSIDVASYLLF